jgi:hypothetical protein
MLGEFKQKDLENLNEISTWTETLHLYAYLLYAYLLYAYLVH